MEHMEHQLQGVLETLARAHAALLRSDAANLACSARLLEQAAETLARLRDDAVFIERCRREGGAHPARGMRALAARIARLNSQLGRFLDLLARLRSSQSGYGLEGAPGASTPASPAALSVVG